MFLVYADDVKTLDGTIYVYTTQKNTKALIFSSEEISLEVQEEKIKYMILSK